MSFRIPDDAALELMLREISPCVIAKISADFDADVTRARISHSLSKKPSGTFNIPTSTDLTESRSSTDSSDFALASNNGVQKNIP
ncbi:MULTISPECIES: hypothetical protein [Lacticaseibacillus]|uniref:Uncharacterized protein n=2 Tax=Lacticaseibacillus TaxID=2759736 RepID=A0AAN1C6J2_LACCA|nr:MULTISPECIES: hypothetical protein [Lacticaseibacillus]ARY90681.1 hypothetical protein BGL52_02435 [Lacticaseibacillus casei]KAB1970536.1 hypothetical protein F9B82_04080 [Lacticaseibacillus casei]WLV81296.1 hypothetical protein LACSTY_000483 [Lacticaseibacillus sp. NCIMB 15473]WNX25256.1 hypothetical protein RWA15_02420 [Lacticaseibacillus casei]WNX28027.1 hypothetical protein RWA16_02420 [Lacticaseibacillus casei]